MDVTRIQLDETTLQILERVPLDAELVKLSISRASIVSEELLAGDLTKKMIVNADPEISDAIGVDPAKVEEWTERTGRRERELVARMAAHYLYGVALGVSHENAPLGAMSYVAYSFLKKEPEDTREWLMDSRAAFDDFPDDVYETVVNDPALLHAIGATVMLVAGIATTYYIKSYRGLTEGTQNERSN